MEYGILGALLLVACIYAIYNVLTSGASTGAKLLWTLLIVLVPLIGFIIWLIAGPKSSAAKI
ncbi:PLD nuclease N-terminal domain-containing protein [Pseudaestuariivita rosea]|uniref:PLD nuclease N-terminal domain-containing protein n=1 Tax=Pseudaestuariivita rosea TaxID=2763263 RepID=UPI001ABA2163|nr:PLD nuclease N-terminal domain-containing protein [Pseudaestuariivita rosea]